MAASALYDLWAAAYPPVAHNPLMAAEDAAVTRRLRGVRATRALDVGTGTGRMLPRLAATGATTIVGLDLSAGMLARHAGATRVRADARHLPFADGAFDLVQASLVAGDIPDVGAWIAELARVLAPGGTLVYSDFHPGWSRRGWRRTFTAADGRVIELPLHAHTLDEHRAGWRAAGLLAVGHDAVRAVRPRLPRWPAPVAAFVFHTRKAGR